MPAAGEHESSVSENRGRRWTIRRGGNRGTRTPMRRRAVFYGDCTSVRITLKVNGRTRWTHNDAPRVRVAGGLCAREGGK